jgi:hypothetical protein
MTHIFACLAIATSRVSLSQQRFVSRLEIERVVTVLSVSGNVSGKPWRQLRMRIFC